MEIAAKYLGRLTDYINVHREGNDPNDPGLPHDANLGVAPDFLVQVNTRRGCGRRWPNAG